jgi:phosphonate transport system substrate-binding protein
MITSIYSAIKHYRINAFKYLCALLLTGLCALASAQDTLDFGIYTSDKPSDMVRQFRPVINALETNLGARLGRPVDIRIQVARSYELGVENLVNGKVDFARFGPASYVMAKQAEPGLRVIVMEQKDGQKQFNGVICVNAQGNIKQVSDLRGKRFAFGNERSTIGRYLSQLYLMEQGIYARDLDSFGYLSRHDMVGTSVGSGRYDAGALKESTYSKLVAEGVPIVSIGHFPNVTKPWVASKALDETLFKALQQSLLEIDDSEALKSLKKDGFSIGADSDFDVIRKAINRNPEFFEGQPEGGA